MTWHAAETHAGGQRSDGGNAALPLGVRAAFWAIGMGLAVIQAWQYRHYVHSDGLSYLDIGTAYWTADWKTALNSHWSPLYSWLIGLPLVVFRPGPRWESTIVHVTNLAIFAAAIASFDFLLRELNRYQAARRPMEPGGATSMPPWALVVLGYTAFLWSSLDLITVSMVMPDLCVAALVYAALGLLIRIRRDAAGPGTAALLGGVLGLGFLAKAPMLPLAAVFLATAGLAASRRASPGRTLGIAAAVLVAVVTPYVTALSLAKGELTTGGSGKYNYARHVGGIVVAVHWQGEPAGTGKPLHPTRKILESPTVYEFAEPIGGTYPPWHDPSYWSAGASFNFRAGRQLSILVRNAKIYARMVLGEQVRGMRTVDRAVPILLLLLAYVGGGFKESFRVFGSHWFVLLPVAAALGLYALVHVEPRYIGGYLAVLAATFCFSLRMRVTPETRRLSTAVPLIACALWLIPTAYSAARMLPTLGRGEDPTGEVFQYRIAEDLRSRGVKRGDRLGFVGEEFRFHWARMLGARVVAEVRQVRSPERNVVWADASELRAAAQAMSPDVDIFWGPDGTARTRALDAFRQAGVSAVVADRLPKGAEQEGWAKIEGTKYGVYRWNSPR